MVSLALADHSAPVAGEDSVELDRASKHGLPEVIKVYSSQVDAPVQGMQVDRGDPS